MVGTPKRLALNKNPIMTSAEKNIRDSMYWKILYALLRAIWHVLKLLKISDSDNPGMDRLYHVPYKPRRAIEKSKKTS